MTDTSSSIDVFVWSAAADYMVVHDLAECLRNAGFNVCTARDARSDARIGDIVENVLCAVFIHGTVSAPPWETDALGEALSVRAQHRELTTVLVALGDADLHRWSSTYPGCTTLRTDDLSCGGTIRELILLVRGVHPSQRRDGAIDAIWPAVLQQANARLQQHGPESRVGAAALIGQALKACSELGATANREVGGALAAEDLRSGLTQERTHLESRKAVIRALRRGRGLDPAAVREALGVEGQAARQRILSDAELAQILRLSLSGFRSLSTSTPLIAALNKLHEHTGYLDPIIAGAAMSESTWPFIPLESSDSIDVYMQELEHKFRALASAKGSDV